MKLKLFLKKNRNRFKPTGFGSIRFDCFRTKTGSNWFGSVFLVWLGFFSGLGSVRVFWFQACKIETEPVSFFKILIGFFHGLVFSTFFFVFSV
jgi:hypothetical protein